MSLAGYFGPEKSRLGGEKSPMKQQREESAEALKIGRFEGESLPGGLIRSGHQDEFYQDVGDYDPVLRAHCRAPVSAER